jgi:hypothetical protein
VGYRPGVIWHGLGISRNLFRRLERLAATTKLMKRSFKRSRGASLTFTPRSLYALQMGPKKYS